MRKITFAVIVVLVLSCACFSFIGCAPAVSEEKVNELQGRLDLLQQTIDIFKDALENSENENSELQDKLDRLEKTLTDLNGALEDADYGDRLLTALLISENYSGGTYGIGDYFNYYERRITCDGYDGTTLTITALNTSTGTDLNGSNSAFYDLCIWSAADGLIDIGDIPLIERYIAPGESLTESVKLKSSKFFIGTMSIISVTTFTPLAYFEV